MDPNWRDNTLSFDAADVKGAVKEFGWQRKHPLKVQEQVWKRSYSLVIHVSCWYVVVSLILILGYPFP